MAKRTVTINPRPMKGKDASAYHEYQAGRELAQQIEAYINANLDEDHPSEFDYWVLAMELKVPKESIADVLKFNGGGSNGITL
jgi:hypothetical protein